MTKLLLVMLAITLAACTPKSGPAKATVEVWKSATCQCCSKWVQHLRDSGFNVSVYDENDLDALKTRFGVPPALASCHTARVDGYTIEGHVPAEDIRRLLADKPTIKGLAVPGMPIGAPGMEAGDQKEVYDVVTIPSSGEPAVYAEHGT
jgi:hypothetical protein